ncbi:MAG: LacI family transcriptional regulator, partial [Chloroflexi bacterium]|nr:LacI family transcriptional regulator [Chloroflexota bacterium]
GPLFDDPELSDLVADGFPIVVQGHQPGLAAPSVDIDNDASARLAVNHLIEVGHRRIACVTNAPLAYTAAADRLAGYREALADAGLVADTRLVAEGAFDAASGHRAMAAILARGEVDAVFVASDVVALGAISALREAGRQVPDDVSLIGFDDIPLATFFDPPLTTVRTPAYELGMAAGTALLDSIAGRDVPLRTLLATQLAIRSSTVPRAR